MKDFTQNLTEGHVSKTLIAFSIPFLLSNLIQAFYSMADMLIVGWFSGSGGLTAVSIGGTVTWLINSLVSGITLGGTVLIGQFIGAKRDKDLHETISTMLTIAVIAAVILTFGMLLLVNPILNIINTPPEAFDQAKSYVSICIGGTFFIFGYNAISGIFRGMGDSKSPLIFVTIACVTNVVLDLILVGPLKMGAAGAAIATVFSQALSMILSIAFMYRNKFIFDFKLKSFKIYKSKAKLIFKIGLPASLQDTATSLSFVFMQAIINSFGVVAADAVGAAGRFNSFAMLPAGAMSMAIASITAQNIGAKLYDRAKETLKIGIKISLAFAVVVFLWAQLLPQTIMYIFTQKADVVAAGSIYIRAFSFDFIMVAFVFCINGFINGCGHTNFSMLNGILSTILVRVPLAYLLSRVLPSGLFGVGLAAPIATLFSILLGAWYIRTGKWKKSAIKH
jgi:putative efflux protein, MATE family